MDRPQRDHPEGSANRCGIVHRAGLAREAGRSTQFTCHRESRADHGASLSIGARSRQIEGDWFDGTVPKNVVIDPEAYVETTYSFQMFRSTLPAGLRIGRGTSVYLGTMFDVGEEGMVSIGDFCLSNGTRIICDREVRIGDYSLISWNVVLMDSYRMPKSSLLRRHWVESGEDDKCGFHEDEEPRPIVIGRNVWVGFDSCVLPGVTIGDGAVVGARSVVVDDVEPYAVAVGNPARIVKRLKAPAVSVDGVQPGVTWQEQEGRKERS